MKHSILCVDDEADNVDALERLFRRKYKVHKATSGQEALNVLKQNKITVIISDQRMPQMTGVELLSESIKTHPDAIRILLTGYTDIESVVKAINNGQIYRYVTKPWDPVDLANAVDKAVERFEIGEELVEKNAALSKALEELKTLDQAKTQFMVLVNHELKTPLTSMMSFSELLGETKLDEEQNRMLSRIKTAANRLQDMVNDALEFVSAETAQMKVDSTKIAAPKLFTENSLPDSIRSLAESRHLKISLAMDDATVVCDQKILGNVYRRLMHNAVKFADEGSNVEVSGEAQKEGLYEVTITNKGKPISESVISQLLKPFTLNENVMHHSVGTGMGLSICQAMLKLHGSQLRFTSKAGQISVSFTLKEA
jgi:two-component system, sensor histidine kinase and response regulator